MATARLLHARIAIEIKIGETVVGNKVTAKLKLHESGTDTWCY